MYREELVAAKARDGLDRSTLSQMGGAAAESRSVYCL